MSPSSSPPPTPSTPRTALPSLLLSTQSRSSAAPTTSSSLLSATTAAHALDFDYDLDPSTITERPSLSLSRVASRASLRSTSTGARGAGASRLASEVASLASVDKDEAEHRVAQKGDDADRDKEEEKAQDDDDDPLSDSSSVSSGFEGILSRVNGGGRTVIGESGKVQTKSKMIATERGKEKDEADTSTERASIPFPTIASLTATSSSSSSLRSASKSRPASPHRSHGPAGVLSTKEGEEDDDEDEDMAAVLVEREEGQADPREMLREQLRRTTTNLRPGLPGRDTEGSSWTVGRSSGREEDGELAVEKKRYREEGRRYFILSTAGKLVFTTDKDESLATGYASVMQAIISIFADEGDRLRMVEAPPVRIYFLLKPPLYLVAVSDWGETEGIMRTHLEYLHLLVISVVTNAQLKNIFGRRQNFDLRRLLEGTEGFFTTLTNTLQTSLSIMMGSLEVYRIEKSVRDDVAAALKVGKIDDLLYVLLISSSRIVTLLRPKRHSIHPTDLHLLLTPILSSTTFRSPGGESWIPICLPKFNDTGFLHAYISFVTEATGVVFVTGDKEGFGPIREVAMGVKDRLLGRGVGMGRSVVHMLERKKGEQEYSIGELGIPGVRHFVYKSRPFVQVTHPAYEGEYRDERNKLRLITLYQRVHETLHPKSMPGAPTRPPAKLIYLRTEKEAVLGWTTASFELYLAVSPLLPQTAVVQAARAISKWVKGEEEKLFLTSAPSF